MLIHNLVDVAYTKILKENRRLGDELRSLPSYNIRILANIVTRQLNEVLEFALRSHGINAQVTSGEYDNILQESEDLDGNDGVVVFWEAANFREGLHYKIDLASEKEREDIADQFEAELQLLMDNLVNVPVAILNRFSSMPFSLQHSFHSGLEKLCRRLNRYMDEHVSDRIIINDTSSIVTYWDSFDLRLYYLSKTLHTIDFHKSYCHQVLPTFLSATGKSKKVIVLDCDNTLWRGVLGEDGMSGIDMSCQSPRGRVFSEAQAIVKALAKNGIIVALCSKNNPEDIEEVISSHPDMVLCKDDITLTKANWDNKASNIRAIAVDLNIGLDSMVFIDDSSFEIEQVRGLLPEVAVYQVPDDRSKYPSLLRDVSRLFYNPSVTVEDRNRFQLYRQEARRKVSASKFTDVNDFLDSLQLSLYWLSVKHVHLSRLSQLTQRTNQFNLTTRRYSERQLLEFIDSEKWLVFAFSCSDRFGDNGIVGMAIVEVIQSRARIDTYLMSCRVIGRKLEVAFLGCVLRRLQTAGIEMVSAEYILSKKNSQVKSFFADMGFSRVNRRADSVLYELELREFVPEAVSFIEIKH